MIFGKLKSHRLDGNIVLDNIRDKVPVGCSGKLEITFSFTHMSIQYVFFIDGFISRNPTGLSSHGSLCGIIEEFTQCVSYSSKKLLMLMKIILLFSIIFHFPHFTYVIKHNYFICGREIPNTLFATKLHALK